jgi:hypothetical protein
MLAELRREAREAGRERQAQRPVNGAIVLLDGIPAGSGR